MSGYHTHELCLTPFQDAPSSVLSRAWDFMRAGYSMFEEPQWNGLLEVHGHNQSQYAVSTSIDPSDEELDEYIQMGAGVQILQRVKLLRAHFTTMLMIIPLEGYRCGFIWKVESSVFNRIQTWNQEAEWDETMKKALAGWVFGLARACNADGFVLRRDYDELRVYTREHIEQKLTRTQYVLDDPLNGSALIGLANLPLSRVHGGQRPSRAYYTVFNRYTVMDLLRRSTYSDD